MAATSQVVVDNDFHTGGTKKHEFGGQNQEINWNWNQTTTFFHSKEGENHWNLKIRNPISLEVNSGKRRDLPIQGGIGIELLADEGSHRDVGDVEELRHAHGKHMPLRHVGAAHEHPLHTSRLPLPPCFLHRRGALAINMLFLRLLPLRPVVLGQRGGGEGTAGRSHPPEEGSGGNGGQEIVESSHGHDVEDSFSSRISSSSWRRKWTAKWGAG